MPGVAAVRLMAPDPDAELEDLRPMSFLPWREDIGERGYTGDCTKRQLGAPCRGFDRPGSKDLQSSHPGS